MGNEDIETGFASGAEPFSDKAIRLAFVRKVYGILSVQLLFTFLPILAMTIYRVKHDADVKGYLHENLTGVMIAVFVSMIFMIVLSVMLSCCENVRRTHPWNLLCLGLYTLATTIMLSFTCVWFETDAVGYAMGFTVVIVLGLTIFAIQTKIDFTVCYQLMFVVLLVFVLFGLTLAITGTRYGLMEKVYASLGAIIFAIFIVIDTQLIVGKGRYEISAEEYVMGALIIYMDIINLFIYLLRLVAASRG